MGPSLARFGRVPHPSHAGAAELPGDFGPKPLGWRKPRLCVPRGWDFRDADVHTTHGQWGEPILGRVSSSASPSPGPCVLAEDGEVGWWHPWLGRVWVRH